MKPIGLWFWRRLYWLENGVDAHLTEVDAKKNIYLIKHGLSFSHGCCLSFTVI
jgi:hypothetical protein